MAKHISHYRTLIWMMGRKMSRGMRCRHHQSKVPISISNYSLTEALSGFHIEAGFRKSAPIKKILLAIENNDIIFTFFLIKEIVRGRIKPQ